jgi:hypothetical protein
LDLRALEEWFVLRRDEGAEERERDRIDRREDGVPDKGAGFGRLRSDPKPSSSPSLATGEAEGLVAAEAAGLER